MTYDRDIEEFIDWVRYLGVEGLAERLRYPWSGARRSLERLAASHGGGDGPPDPALSETVVADG